MNKKSFNSYIGNSYTKNGKEVFSWKKFAHIFYLGSAVEWAKSIKEIIDLRKAIIYLLILAGFFIYGYNKGWQGKPIQVDITRGEEVYIKLNGEFLHIDKDGFVYIEDKKGNKLKQISVKDIPNLRKALSPIGLQLVPIGVIGASVGTSGVGAEGGVGVSFFRFWKGRLDAFITSYPAVYLGTSYKLDGIGLKNSAIGIGLGKGFKDFEEDTRTIIYFRVRF